MLKTILITILLSLPLSSYAYNLEEIYEVLIHLESNNNPKAIGDSGKAYGILQIHKICVKDINRLYDTNYTHEQAFSETYSREMFFLYMSYGIKRFKVKHCRSPTEEEVVQFWNWGLYRIPKNNNYYKRYLKYEKILLNKD